MAERASNKTSEAIIVCLSPDVCKTPMGSAMVPVPYPIISKFDLGQKVAQKSNFEGNPVFHMGSHLSTVMGDEPGVGGGVTSGVNKGCCKPVQHSSTLRVEGEWVVRHGDIMDMNCSGPKGTGNTKGKIIFISVLKQSRVNADGSITYTEQEEIKDDAGNTTLQRVEVTTNSEGQVTSVESGQKTTNAAGQPTQIERSSYKFDDSGNLASSNTTSTTLTPAVTPSGSGPVLGNSQIGKIQPDGRTYVGDGMYVSNAPASSSPSTSASTPQVASGTPATNTTPAPQKIASNDPELLADPDYQAAQAAQAKADADVSAINKEMAWEGAKTAVDVAGLVDPTPASDLIGGGMALADGDFLGAGLSLISIVPYVGDAVAKPFKGARTAAKVAKLAAKLDKAKDKLKAAKEAAEKAMKAAEEKLAKLRKAKKEGKLKPEEPPKAPASDGGKVPGKRPRGPDRKKWKEKGGKIKEHPDGSVTYTNKDGVSTTYNKEGYPDFSPHLDHPSGVKEVEIPKMTGDNYKDFKAANEAAGHPEWGGKSPPDYTWHHKEGGNTMQLVPRKTHSEFQHTGGASQARNAGG